jgi:hypothetical protein
MNLLQASICAHRLKSEATQTKPASAGFNHNFLLVRVGGLGLSSREFIRQVFLPEAHRLKSEATQTKPAEAGFNHNFLLVRVGGLGLSSREFIRQVFLPEVYYLEGVQ